MPTNQKTSLISRTQPDMEILHNLRINNAGIKISLHGVTTMWTFQEYFFEEHRLDLFDLVLSPRYMTLLLFITLRIMVSSVSLFMNWNKSLCTCCMWLSNMSIKYMGIPSLWMQEQVKLCQHVEHIKGSCAWFDLDLMFELTQILTTSKAPWQTGVNLIMKLVTFKMDINQQASVLRKKLEKLSWQLENNPDLSKNKRKKLQDEVDDIKEKLKALEGQLTLLAVTKVMRKTHQSDRQVSWGGKGKAFPGLCTGKAVQWAT